jgi:seryl-tRNA(Sec) selenium transferase
LYRGYDNVCNLKPNKFCSDGTNKSFTTDTIVKEHICELVFANCSKLEELRTEYNRNILSKNKNNKPCELLKYEQKQEEQVVVTHRVEEVLDEFFRQLEEEN